MLLTYDVVHITSDARINPHLEQVTPLVEAFCKQHHIWLPQFAQYHTMTAYLYPRTSAQRLIALNIFMNLLWFVDDTFDNLRLNDPAAQNTAQVSQIFHIATDLLIHGTLPPQAGMDWLRACAALRDQIVALGNEAWLGRLAKSLGNHLQSITYTLDEVIVDGKPDLERYLAVRQRDSGMLVAIDGIELAYDMELPAALYAHPILAQARDCAAHVGGLMNDLMSYHHDEREGNRFNLIAILRETQGLDAAGGIHGAVTIINQYIRTFEGCEEALKADPQLAQNPLATAYMEGLRDQIEASWHWQLATGRYRSPDAYYHRLQRA